jgi:hypothetical protein
VCGTTIREMGQFGPGIGLLFHTIRGLGFALIISSVCLIPVLQHYMSSDYSRNPYRDDVRAIGSAVCTDMMIVNATKSGVDVAAPWARCNFTVQQGIFDIACAGAIFLSAVWLNRVRHQYDAALDEAEQTAQDYSVEVIDPPDDAVHPDEWMEYFSQFGEVALVTIALDNGPLLRALTVHAYSKQMCDNEVGSHGAGLDGEPLDVDALTKFVEKLPSFLRTRVQTAGFGRDVLVRSK